MMTKNQALSLEPGMRVKYGREIFIVDHRTDVGTHEEPVLIAESGRRLVGTLFIAHLLSFVDRPQTQAVEPDSYPMGEFKDDLETEGQDDQYGLETNDLMSHYFGPVHPVEEFPLTYSSEAPAAEETGIEAPVIDQEVKQELAVPVQAHPELPVADGIPAEELAILEVLEKDEAV